MDLLKYTFPNNTFHLKSVFDLKIHLFILRSRDIEKCTLRDASRESFECCKCEAGRTSLILANTGAEKF